MTFGFKRSHICRKRSVGILADGVGDILSSFGEFNEMMAGSTSNTNARDGVATLVSLCYGGINYT